jgi:hypothetical protein
VTPAAVERAVAIVDDALHMLPPWRAEEQRAAISALFELRLALVNTLIVSPIVPAADRAVSQHSGSDPTAATPNKE